MNFFFLILFFTAVSSQQIQSVFLDKIFSVYAHENRVVLSEILHEMGLESDKHHHYKRQLEIPDKCFDSNELLELYGFQGNVSKSQMMDLMPALVFMSATKQCTESKPQRSAPPVQLKWLYSILSISIVTVTAALGIFFIPVIFKRPVVGDLFMSFLIALSAGVLLSDALLHLIPELLETSGSHDHHNNVWLTSMVAAGVYFFWVIEKYLHSKVCPHDHKHYNDHEPRPAVKGDGLIGELKKAKPVAILLIFGDTFCHFVDGLTIGASFATDLTLGVTSALAIFCHEIPHQLGSYSVFLASGISKYKAAICNVFSNWSAYIGMIIGILLIDHSTEVKKWILAFGAGSFLYISLVGLLPEMALVHVMDESNRHLVNGNSWKKTFSQHFGLILGWLIMLLIALYGENILQ